MIEDVGQQSFRSHPAVQSQVSSVEVDDNVFNVPDHGPEVIVQTADDYALDADLKPSIRVLRVSGILDLLCSKRTNSSDR